MSAQNSNEAWLCYDEKLRNGSSSWPSLVMPGLSALTGLMQQDLCQCNAVPARVITPDSFQAQHSRYVPHYDQSQFKSHTTNKDFTHHIVLGIKYSFNISYLGPPFAYTSILLSMMQSAKSLIRLSPDSRIAKTWRVHASNAWYTQLTGIWWMIFLIEKWVIMLLYLMRLRQSTNGGLPPCMGKGIKLLPTHHTDTSTKRGYSVYWWLALVSHENSSISSLNHCDNRAVVWQ